MCSSYTTTDLLDTVHYPSAVVAVARRNTSTTEVLLTYYSIDSRLGSPKLYNSETHMVLVPGPIFIHILQLLKS